MTYTAELPVSHATVKLMPTGEKGFGYVFLLVLIAVLGGVSAYALEEGQLLSRRQAEQELLRLGRNFEEALYSYSGMRLPESHNGQSSLVTMSTGPAQLEDLLRDPRVPGVRRHLRKIYADPLTGKTEWGLVRNHAGRIVGIYSLATGTPIKRGDFDARHANFDDSQSYQDWKFGLPVAETLIPRQ